MNGVLAQHPKYVAPIGAKSSFSLWFYKEAAPTALRAKIGGRLGGGGSYCFYILPYGTRRAKIGGRLGGGGSAP
jgi:hypothetical protein